MIKLGDRGTEVEKLQDYLINMGYLSEREYNYGPKTKVAVMSLQEELGYQQTGVWEDDLALLKEINDDKGVRLFSARAGMKFKEGDKVIIVGQNAFYGGLSSDYGVLVPSSQKNGKKHTVMQVSTERREYLLKEIYSWVPEEFIQAYSENNADPAGKPDSDIKTSVAPGSGEEQSNNYYSIPVDAIPCYVINVNTQTKVDFDISPESVSDNVMATFEDQITKSRPSPFKAYSNSGPREVSFTVILYADYCKMGIVKTVRCLQALTVPVKAGGYVREPKCRCRIGDFINITGVCLSVSVEWEKPYKDNVYSKAEVTFSFNEVEDEPKFADTWEGQS